MEKFRFTQIREEKTWYKETYEIEAESYDEAIEMLEDSDYDFDSLEAECVSDSDIDTDRTDMLGHGPRHTVIEDYDGEEIFDGML